MNEDPLIHAGEYIAYFPEIGRTLGSTDRAIVLQYLWYRRDRTTGRAVLPLDELAEKTGITYATVRRVTDWLIKNGHLVKHRASTWDPTSTWEIRWNDGAAQSEQHVVPNLSSSQVRKVSNTQVRNLSITSSKNFEELEEQRESTPSSVRKRTTTGTRLPDDWTPSDELKAWTLKEFPGLHGPTVAAKFRDHYKAASGTRGVSVDWDASWRNWCRRERDTGTPASTKRPGAEFWSKTVTDPYGLDPNTQALFDRS